MKRRKQILIDGKILKLILTLLISYTLNMYTKKYIAKKVIEIFRMELFIVKLNLSMKSEALFKTDGLNDNGHTVI